MIIFQKLDPKSYFFKQIFSCPNKTQNSATTHVVGTATFSLLHQTSFPGIARAFKARYRKI